MCSHKLKVENVLNRIFILLPESFPGVGLVGAGGVKNFGVGICDGPPSTARSSIYLTVGPIPGADPGFLVRVY